MRVLEQGDFWGKGNTIKEGKNIIMIDMGTDEKDREDGLDYLDKKYNEGWEIVANYHLLEFILHKKE